MLKETPPGLETGVPWTSLDMAFCYRFKLRVSLPRSKLADKIISFSVSVPRKCRRFSRGR